MSKDTMKNFLTLFSTECRRLISERDICHLLVCVSGGKDSVALLDLLHRYCQENPLSLSLFHLNHNTRNGESDRDAAFVSDLSHQYGLPLYSFSHFFDTDKNFEEEARRVRYTYIRKVLLEQSVDGAATAHTASDNIETTLMRLFRGTSIYGLRGMDQMRGQIIRPLLFASTDDIIAYCRENRLSYVTDSSNTDMTFERNYMRHKIVPAVAKRYPLESSVTAIQQHAILTYRMALKYVLSLTRVEEKEYQKLYNIDISVVSDEELSFLLSHILREDMDAKFTRFSIAEVVKKIHAPSNRILLYQEQDHYLFKNRCNNILSLIVSDIDFSYSPQWNEAEIGLQTGKEVVENKFFSLKLSLLGPDQYREDEEGGTVIFIEGKDIGDYTIRTRKSGDEIISGGMARKLKKEYINRKLTPFQKSVTPVICYKQHIAAVLFPDESLIADDFRVSDKTKKILAIRYTQKYELKN